MNIDMVNLSDVKAAGANVDVPAVLGASHFDEYVDKDGDGGGSNCPRDFACPSEEPRNHAVHAQLAGWTLCVRLGRV
jgi:hypothetical protein